MRGMVVNLPKKNLNTSRRNSCCNPITSDTHSFTKGRSSHDEDDRYSDKDQSSCLNSRNSTKTIPKKKSDSKRSQSFEHSTTKCGNKDCNTTSKSDTNIPYLQDLLIQFDNARHKLNTAVKLATTTLEHYTSRDSKDSIDGSCSNDNSTCSKWRNSTRVDQDNYTRNIGNTSMNRQPPVLDTLYSKKSDMSRSSSRMMASKKAEELQSTLNSLLEGSLTETSHFDHDISAIPKCCKESKSSNSLKFARSTLSAHSRD
ncbi:uncharacterized protein LOC115888630 [Sitophilus oryzae]|uniref:Uncharacterized protein LOC115888630 n=1 Tax=Sitophilus oryzae TaxID=7048 RepID=A0A6J2YM62_SITOR|nr:uncharacterized protein LOC115888630 [Sitophilus oryzae]